MAIFIIGVEKLNNERYFRLFNSKVNENNVRDISEKDLTYLMRGNSNFKVQNAELKDGKITGTTGSLNKVENEVCFTVVGAINQNGNLAGYRFVDTLGNVYNMRIEEAVMFLNGKPIQNASVVNGAFIRGINWEIPVIEDKKGMSNEKDKKLKPIYVHIDVQHMAYRFSKEMTDSVKSQIPEEFVADNQFLVYLQGPVYTIYVPNEIAKEFAGFVRAKLNTHPAFFGKKENMSVIQVAYIKKGFREELTGLQEAAKQCGASIEVLLTRSTDKEFMDTTGNYENEIWNIISDAKSSGMKLKKYFFLGSDTTVFGNLKGALLSYVNGLDKQLKKICQSLGIKYSMNFSKGTSSKIKVIDYIAMDTCPYGCILVEMEER